jgi:hypothetical protein
MPDGSPAERAVTAASSSSRSKVPTGSPVRFHQMLVEGCQTLTSPSAGSAPDAPTGCAVHPH